MLHLSLFLSEFQFLLPLFLFHILLCFFTFTFNFLFDFQFIFLLHLLLFQIFRNSILLLFILPKSFFSIILYPTFTFMIFFTVLGGLLCSHEECAKDCHFFVIVSITLAQNTPEFLSMKLKKLNLKLIHLGKIIQDILCQTEI